MWHQNIYIYIMLGGRAWWFGGIVGCGLQNQRTTWSTIQRAWPSNAPSFFFLCQNSHIYIYIAWKSHVQIWWINSQSHYSTSCCAALFTAPNHLLFEKVLLLPVDCPCYFFLFFISQSTPVIQINKYTNFSFF